MNLLFITYDFPPKKQISSERSYNFAKYLPKCGVEVDVITCITKKQKEIVASELDGANIFNIESKLENFIKKIKIPSILNLLNLNYIYLFPNILFSWTRKAKKIGSKIIEMKKIDAIMATGLPFSTFFVAKDLSNKYNIPLILEYRDPWSGNPFIKSPFRFVEKIIKLREKKIISQAEIRITVGPEYANIIAKSLDISSNDFYIIYNGFFLEKKINRTVKKPRNIFIISYFGNIYKLRLTSMKIFLKGLKKMIDINKLSPNKIKFQYAGTTSRAHINKLIKLVEMEDYFVDLGYLKKDELMEKISESHILVATSPKNAEFTLPTKIYYYALGNSHVVLVGKKGATSNLFDEIEQEYTLISENSDKIANKITELYNKWVKNNLKFGCNKEKLSKYSRKNQAIALANLLKEKIEHN